MKLINKIIIFIIAISFFPFSIAYAFLPPEFFVQGLASIWAIIAGGIAIAFLPMIMFWRFIKNLFKKHKKIIAFLVIQNIILAIATGVVFYYKFYEPLYKSSYLVSQGYKNQNASNGAGFKKEIELDIKELNSDFKIQNEYLRDKHNDKDMSQNLQYALSAQEIEKMIQNQEKIYFLDIREIEEYKTGHIKNSKHLRGMDLTLEKIKSTFGLNEEMFKQSTIILVCHDGGRGKIQTTYLNEKNIKYIIGGIEIFENYKNNIIQLTGPVFADYELFDKKYQSKYQMWAKDAIKMIKNNSNVLIIDGRHKQFYEQGHISGSIQLNIGRMTEEEYQNSLNKIFKKQGSEIIILCSRYGELFHANLLLLRLEKNYGFDNNKFHIVFNQFDNFKNSFDIQWVQ